MLGLLGLLKTDKTISSHIVHPETVDLLNRVVQGRVKLFDKLCLSMFRVRSGAKLLPYDVSIDVAETFTSASLLLYQHTFHQLVKCF